MILQKTLMVAALAALLGQQALAQETATGDTAATAETEGGAAPAEGEAGAAAQDPNLAMGQSAEDAIGAPYTKEQIGDWSVQCVRTESGEDPCQMYQLLSDGDGNAVAEFTLFRLPAGQQAVAGAMIAVPLETLLTQQITISVDGSGAKRYPFLFCNPVGCYARVGFTAEDITRFKRGNVARVTIVPMLAPDQKVNLDLSLKGFTATYDKASIVEQ